MIGQTFGNYRIDAKRGEGGMGMFFRATDLQLDRVVGLKTLRPELLADPDLRDRLHTEARSLARLVHQNIANVLHYLVQDEMHFIVMEYVDGKDLGEIIKKSGLPSLDQMGSIVAQICAAVGYANSKGVIHRDLKPSNIMLTADGTVKVTDFGIAKILGAQSQTRTGVAAGSLHYMAPEQIGGKPVDQRTDVYQLGATLYELTTGKKPFVSDNEYELMTMQLNQMPEPPSQANARVPATLDRVILKAMAKDPNDRFPSVGELNTAFQAALAGQTLDDDEKTRYVVTPQDGRTTQRSAHVEDKTIVGGQPVVAEPRRRRASRDRQSSQDNEPGGSKIGLWIGIAAVIVVAIGAYMFWPKPAPEPTPTETQTTTTAVCTLMVAATIPSDVPASDLSVLTMEVHHPATGTTVDTVRAVGGQVDERLVAEPAASVDIVFTGTNADGRIIVSGQGSSVAPAGGNESVNVPLKYIAPPVAHTVPPAEQKPPVQQQQQETHTETQTTPPASFENLALNVTPFSKRQSIDRLWIDGRQIDDPGDFEFKANPGVRKIRVAIGNDRLTDTVNVPAQGKVEKTIFIGSGRGRINVAALFPEGAGYADIYLDGVKTDYGTPFELRDVLEGPHEVEVRQAGYHARHGGLLVEVKANGRVRAEFEMIKD